MALIDDQPTGLVSTNALDHLTADVPLFDTPPAYLKFGVGPAAMENPPQQGDIVTYMVRARCTGEHGPLERKDGEMRYERSMSIQAVWLPGQRPPTADDDAQPALINTDGEIDDDAADPADSDDGEDNVLRPGFSDHNA